MALKVLMVTALLVLLVTTAAAFPTQNNIECDEDDIRCNFIKRSPTKSFATEADTLYDLMKFLKYRSDANNAKLGSFNAPIIG